MEGQSNLSTRTKIYVALVVLAGAAAIVLSVAEIWTGGIPWEWCLLAGLTLFSGSLTVKVPKVPATFSVSETFVFTAVLFYGSGPGTIIVALDGFIISLWKSKRRLHRILFNAAEPGISVFVASKLLFLLAGDHPLSLGQTIPELIWPVLVFTVVYFGLNSSLTAIAIALEKDASPFRVWREHFLWLSLNYFAGASVALLLARDSGGKLHLWAVGAIIPLLTISYLTFKFALDRINQATRHIDKLNSLYLSTIETLAMAIDAKDQITHGHIRRVQVFAVKLARALGVRDEEQLQALEAAALLHDMGKLAVPEYILNKPGKLSAAEFEKMKLHATVGADILSAIDFPYPVVPTVRHHHENWDGSGYPDGLKRADIPIGARILAVVDCFDALTSDRPYRPALDDAEALAILRQRRGTMYDPDVVDRFESIYREISASIVEQSATATALGRALLSGTHGSQAEAPGICCALDDISSSTEEMLLLFDLARALGGRATLADTADVIAGHLGRIVPSALCVFYLYEAASDQLVACHATGDGAASVGGLRIDLGGRVTGWAAANRRSILNSDPVLDFTGTRTPALVGLRSCLSTALVASDGLVGALTLYSRKVSAYNEEHRRVVEVVGAQIAAALRDSAAFDRASVTLRDAVTGLPNLERLRQVTASAVPLDGLEAHPVTLLFIDINDLRSVNESYGRDAGDGLLAHVGAVTRRALRAADILFRYEADEFVVLLSQTDLRTAMAIGQRIESALSMQPYVFDDGKSVSASLTWSVAAPPEDGVSLSQLIDSARRRLFSPEYSEPSTSSRIH